MLNEELRIYSSVGRVLSSKESLESFKSQAPYKLGVVVPASNHSTWDMKTERYEFNVIFSSIWSRQTNLGQVRHCLKKNKDKAQYGSAHL